MRVYRNDTVRGYFLNDLQRVRGDYQLREHWRDKSYKSTLKVGVHINIGLIQYNYCIVRTLRYEPHCLHPHLQTMPHPADLCFKIMDSDKKLKNSTLIGKN